MGENEELIKKYNLMKKNAMSLAKRIDDTVKTINELETTGWIEESNGTVNGYAPAKECCKLRLEFIKQILQGKIKRDDTK